MSLVWVPANFFPDMSFANPRQWDGDRFRSVRPYPTGGIVRVGIWDLIDSLFSRKERPDRYPAAIEEVWLRRTWRS